jgi:hypothetical protein
VRLCTAGRCQARGGTDAVGQLPTSANPGDWPGRGQLPVTPPAPLALPGLGALHPPPPAPLALPGLGALHPPTPAPLALFALGGPHLALPPPACPGLGGVR